VCVLEFEPLQALCLKEVVIRWVKGLMVVSLALLFASYSFGVEYFGEHYVEGGGIFNDAGTYEGWDVYKWFVGDGGLVYRYLYDYNDGEYVTLNVTPSITQSDWNFKGICMIPYSNTLFIVGEKVGERKGIILRSTDDGNTWSATYPTADGYDLACFSIDYANSDILYVGCSRGYILKTTNGGGTWNKTEAPPVEPDLDKHADCFVGIWVDKNNPDNVWAVADNSGLIVKTVNGGQSWGRFPDKFPNSEWQVNPGWGVEDVNEGAFHIRARDMQEAYVSISSGKYGYTEDGGGTWNTAQIYPSSTQWLYDMGLRDYDIFPMVGSNGIIIDYNEDLWRYHAVYDLTSVDQVPETGGAYWLASGNNEAKISYEALPGIEENIWYVQYITCTGESQRVKIEMDLYSTVYEGSVERLVIIQRALVREGPYEDIDSFWHTVRADHPEDLHITKYDATVTYQMTYWYRVRTYYGCSWFSNADDAIPYDLEPADNPANLYNYAASDSAGDHGGNVYLEWNTDIPNECYYIYRKPIPGEGIPGDFDHITDFNQIATVSGLHYTDPDALTGWDVEYKIVGFNGIAVTDPVFVSCEPTDDLAPPKVTGLTGHWNRSEKTVYLKWNSTSETGEPNLGGYWVCPEVIYPDGTPGPKGNLNNVSPVERNWYQEKRSDPVGTDLVYKVAAMDRSGNVGEWSDEYVITVTSGCPFLYTWNGEKFVEDNNILPTSELYPDKDVTDHYLLEKPLVEQAEGYILKMAEYESELSYLNQVKLLTVDHPADIDVIVDQDGNILSIEKETKPLSCSDEKKKNQKSKVDYKDGECYIAEKGSHLIVTLDPTIDRALVHPWIAIKAAYLPQLKVADGDTWSDLSPVLSRWNWSGGGVALPQGTDKIKIEFFTNNRLDYLGIVSCGEGDVKVQEGGLIEAKDSGGNSVKDLLLELDDKYAKLIPDNVITLCFDVPNKEPGWVRDFVFVSNGRYIRSGGGGGQTADSNIPIIHSLFLHPNPARNDMTIKFGIPKEERVSLKVYDVSGREVKTLVDGRLEAGYHTIRLDGKSLPTGIYFARLATDGYKATRKLVLMK